MSISDLPFVFLFLPLAAIAYYIVPRRARNVFLIAASLVFYSNFSFKYTVFLFAAMIVNVTLAVIIDKLKIQPLRKVFFISGTVLNVASLCFYKYVDFAFSVIAPESASSLRSLALPVGISFFTFKAISLLADTYKKKIQKTNVFQAAVYLSFFGQIISGPITRYSDFDDAKFDVGLISEGLLKFICGFNKKILLANILSKIATEVSGAGETSTAYLWLGSVCYSLYLFFDFSGYSDMAIGASNIFGFKCEKNFDYPYTTKSVSEFWRRWHISLGSWFRDYVYFPMGGSRVKSKARLVFNLFVVWILTGIWHGSTLNFIIWGLCYFAVIALEKLTGFPAKRGNSVSRVIYRSDPLTDKRALILLCENAVFIIAAIIFCLPVIPWIREKLKKKKALGTVFNCVVYAATLILFVIAVSFLVAGQNNPFAYANF